MRIESDPPWRPVGAPRASASSFSLSVRPLPTGPICRGSGRWQEEWPVGDGHFGVPFPESGTPGKPKCTQTWPARGKGERPHAPRPSAGEPACLLSRQRAAPQWPARPAPPGSAWGGAAPGTCSAWAAQGRAWETRRPLRDAAARDAPAAHLCIALGGRGRLDAALPGSRAPLR